MIQINLYNTDVDDNFVTLTDNNMNPPAVVPGCNSCRINSKKLVPMQVQEDGSGYGNVSWTALRCNDATVTNSGNDTPQNGFQVDVHAN